MGWSIQKATELVLHKKAAALVTGPISKDRLQKGGYLYTGHTDFLADLCKGPQSALEVTPQVTMMLANSQLRVTLVTTHISISNLSGALDRQKIRKTILQTVQGLTQYWGIAKPRIAVAALNPHAGENGLFGQEEIQIIEPEICALQKEGYDVIGPLPADTLFAKHVEKEHFDAIVCMYHDQGLIPVKLLDFYGTVNITLGLPMIRTSVDHGVGFDIAGKGIANPSSLIAAIDLAAHLASKGNGPSRSGKGK